VETVQRYIAEMKMRGGRSPVHGLPAWPQMSDKRQRSLFNEPETSADLLDEVRPRQSGRPVSLSKLAQLKFAVF